MRCHITVFALILVAAGAAATQEPTEAMDLSRHPARLAESWKPWLRKSLRERLKPAPAMLVDYLRKDNQKNGYPEVPRSAELTEDFFKDIESALADIPDAVIELIEPYLTGVYLVRDLGTSGFCDTAFSASGPPLCYIVLDLGFLDRTANEWATWKESSPFRSSGHLGIRATIEPAHRDDRAGALRYILLHEFGHVVGATQGLHPDWNGDGDPDKFSFSRLSWKRENGKLTSRWDPTFNLRPKLRYYAFDKAELPTSEAVAAYRQLEATDFCTLYAATNPFDDFAEFFVTYAHTVLAGQQVEVQILDGEKVICRLDVDLSAPRFAAKRRILDGIFAAWRRGRGRWPPRN